jgi:hypothetical protein
MWTVEDKLLTESRLTVIWPGLMRTQKDAILDNQYTMAVYNLAGAK